MKGNKSGFFAIYKSDFYRACNLGMNAAVAYLVLSTGTDKTNKFTSWSVNAIESYTGISRKRAQLAIQALLNNGLIRKLNVGTERPRYEILHFEPTISKRGKRKTVESEDTPTEKRLESEKVIWLPNGVVQSVQGELPPLERIRQTQDVMVLCLFVDMYSEQNLVDDAGVARYVYRQKYSRKLITKHAQFNIFGFDIDHSSMSWGAITSPHKRDDGEHGAVDYFQRISLLIGLGLVVVTPYLFDSDSQEGEVIHQLDNEVYTWAYDAARHMLNTIMGEDRAMNEMANHRLIVPVLQHVQNVAVIGIAEMLYKPRTKLTSLGYSEKKKREIMAINSYREWSSHFKSSAFSSVANF